MLAALLVGTVTVPLAGGRLDRLHDLRLRSVWLLLVALLLQLSITTLWTVPPGPATTIHVASYVVAAAWLLRNLHVRGVPIVAAGGGANAAAIVANGGVMPAYPAALRTAGLAHDPTAFANSAAVADARLWVLGDVFAVPASWPLSNVFSIGDVVLVVGALYLLHSAAGSRLAPPARSPAVPAAPA